MSSLEYLCSDNEIIGLLSNCFGTQLYTNGILSFNFPFFGYWRPQTLSLANVPLIAPFWVRHIRFGSTFYRVTSNATLLKRARDRLQELFPSSGNFTPTTLFIATWDRVAQLGGGSEVSTTYIMSL